MHSPDKKTQLNWPKMIQVVSLYQSLGFQVPIWNQGCLAIAAQLLYLGGNWFVILFLTLYGQVRVRIMNSFHSIGFISRSENDLVRSI